MDDKSIVDLYWKRNEAAIHETAVKYGGYCYSIAFHILANKEDAEESVNDAYLNAWNSMPPHRPAVLSAFLGKLTRYASLKKWRDQRALKRGGGSVMTAYEELSECIPAGRDIEEAIEARELAEIINAFLDTLPFYEQRVFIRRYWYFDSISEIAGRFGFGRSKVKSMLYRTRKKLAARLNEEGIFIEY